MRKSFVILAVILVLLVTLHDGARAQIVGLEVAGGARSFTIGGNVVYSVKFLCGKNLAVLPSLNSPSPLAAGFYLTAINIHNVDSATASFAFSVNGNAVHDFQMAPGSVLGLDCGNFSLPGPFSLPGSQFPGPIPLNTPFTDGFVTLHFLKNPHINVVPVYTVTPLPLG